MVKVKLVALALALIAMANNSLADDQMRKASVVCTTDASAYPFSAGNDRCFKDISRNGKWERLALKSATACALNTSDGLRLYFIDSTESEATCALMSSPVTKEEYEWGLAALGAEERAFFEAHRQ